MSEPISLKLPGSSYDVVSRILHAYSLFGDVDVKLDDIATKAGVHRTEASSNHAFLHSVGLLEGGKRKKLTEPGRRLAIAISNHLTDEVQRAWRDVLSTAPVMRPVIDMFRVQGSIASGECGNRISHALSLPSGPTTRTGTNCLIEIMKSCGLLTEQDGKLSLSTPVPLAPVSPTIETDAAVAPAPPLTPNQPSLTGPLQPPSAVPSLHVDVQIHIPPEATQEQIDHIFASMAKHLYHRQ